MGYYVKGETNRAFIIKHSSFKNATRDALQLNANNLLKVGGNTHLWNLKHNPNSKTIREYDHELKQSYSNDLDQHFGWASADYDAKARNTEHTVQDLKDDRQRDLKVLDGVDVKNVLKNSRDTELKDRVRHIRNNYQSASRLLKSVPKIGRYGLVLFNILRAFCFSDIRFNNRGDLVHLEYDMKTGCEGYLLRTLAPYVSNPSAKMTLTGEDHHVFDYDFSTLAKLQWSLNDISDNAVSLSKAIADTLKSHQSIESLKNDYIGIANSAYHFGVNSLGKLAGHYSVYHNKYVYMPEKPILDLAPLIYSVSLSSYLTNFSDLKLTMSAQNKFFSNRPLIQTGRPNADDTQLKKLIVRHLKRTKYDFEVISRTVTNLAK